MMRTPIAALGALLLVATSLRAQQSPGVLSNPVASPVLPDIVAFDRVVNDRQELQFLRLSSDQTFSSTRVPPAARRGMMVTLPDVTAGLSAYAGQLDWRPVAEQGRSWFAYVASDDKGSVGLMLNYIDGGGQLAKTDPIRVPFDGQARAPRWSRDGKHLAFVSDSSVLYIVSDVLSALRAGNASTLKPTRITAASRPALFPAWSPFGDHIAYGIETVSRGNRNGAIEVLPVSPASGRVIGTPVVVTGELIGDNEYRPSWSPDGKYVAFYADQSGMGGTRQQVSIGVAEVIMNSRTGQVFRGVVKEGSQRWLADNVIPDEVRGPAWTSITEGSQKKDALLYVLRNPARSNPILVAAFQRWVDQVPRDQYETEMSTGWGATNPKSISATEMSLKMRFVFTSVKGGGDVVSFHDAVAMWAKGPEPERRVIADRPTGAAKEANAPVQDEVVVIYAHKGKDVAQALLFPGLGQFSAGSKSKGMFLTGAGLVGAVVGGIGYSGMSAPLSAGKAAVDAISRDPSTISVQTGNFNRAKSDFDGKRSVAMLGGAVFAAAWLYGILDVSVGSAPGAAGFSFNLVPDRTGEGSIAGRLAFAVPIGSARR